MSDNWISLIPTDPGFIPSADALQKTRDLLTFFLPDADDVNGLISEKIEFVHPGGNWSGVFCPTCNIDLERFWKEAMDKAFDQSEFRNLNVTLPCCKATASLNNLRYPWPAGFAQCKIEAMNPNVRDLDPAQFHQLEQTFGHSLRRIWIHV